MSKKISKKEVAKKMPKQMSKSQEKRIKCQEQSIEAQKEFEMPTITLTSEDIIKIVEETLSRTLSNMQLHRDGIMKLSKNDKPIKKSVKKKKKVTKEKVTKEKVIKKKADSKKKNRKVSENVTEVVVQERRQGKKRKKKIGKKIDSQDFRNRGQDKDVEKEKQDIPCRIERMDVSGNRRLKTDAELGIKNTNKKDRNIDRLLSGSNEITPRPPSRTVEVECSGGCGYIYEVSPSLLMKEDGEYIYMCNDCSVQKKR